MTAAVYDTISVDIDVNEYKFKASGQNLKFKGFMTLYVEGNDSKEDEEESTNIPKLELNQEVKKEKLDAKQSFTEPPARYTEASLVKELETKGIGRPSTYSPIITTIIERRYIEKDKKQLVPTQLGEVVNTLLTENFTDIIDVTFTARVEDEFDEVAEGKEEWKQILREFYPPFEKELEKIESKRGKADTIRTRLVRTISQKSKSDPAYYKKFSQRIEETIEEYRNRRISDSEYLEKMQSIKEDFRQGNSGISYPSNITTENSRAFYGVIYDRLITKMNENANIEELGDIALVIQKEIESKVKVDWHNNKDIHNELAQYIEDTIYTYKSRKNIDLSFEEIDLIIEEIIGIALIKY